MLVLHRPQTCERSLPIQFFPVAGVHDFIPLGHFLIETNPAGQIVGVQGVELPVVGLQRVAKFPPRCFAAEYRYEEQRNDLAQNAEH